MIHKLRPADIYDTFNYMTKVEILSAASVMKVGEEKDQYMSQGYILAIERCRNLLRSIMKDVEC